MAHFLQAVTAEQSLLLLFADFRFKIF